MCQITTEKGQVRFQACDYGSVVGTIVSQNPHKTKPKVLFSCSNCGILTEYGMHLRDFITDLRTRGVRFKLNLDEKAVLVGGELTDYGAWLEDLITDLKRKGEGFELYTKVVLTNK